MTDRLQSIRERYSSDLQEDGVRFFRVDDIAYLLRCVEAGDMLVQWMAMPEPPDDLGVYTQTMRHKWLAARDNALAAWRQAREG